MRRLLVATVLLGALGLSAAPARADDAAIASRSGIPSPRATIIHAPCPDVGGSCAYADGRVYLARGASRFARQHELGHVFDTQFLDEGERNKLQRLLGLPRGPWFDGTGEGSASPSEMFADAYAACRLQLDPMGLWQVSYGYLPTRRQHRLVCATIVRARH